MQIDFTQSKAPIDVLNLSEWTPAPGPEMTEEEAALIGIDLERLDREYAIGPRSVDLQFTDRYRLRFDAASVVADVRGRDRSLRSIRVRSEPLSAEELFKAILPVVREWGLHAFEGMEEDVLAPGESFEEEEDWLDEDLPEPTKIDGATALDQWRQAPPDLLPSFLAQTDPDPAGGIAFLRVVINPALESDSRFIASIQVFWQGSTAVEDAAPRN
ncbi:hypothetical protein [Alienimonas chondri]|uniref:Uncharacterized protein n=1 Tax=Alienimonas chondri TaxID=2681879 RepID=A0ABX1VJN5_9PLAN|nr:hypothetical protein [Alienimonas chondri]NNJ27680.1 hypothetical protein [Alienimonas chondri]